MELSILPKGNENRLKIVELIEQRQTDKTDKRQIVSFDGRAILLLGALSGTYLGTNPV